eukprot:TsM_000957800 transcript=TsM_000957800 gene=TsM_000957800
MAKEDLSDRPNNSGDRKFLLTLDGEQASLPSGENVFLPPHFSSPTKRPATKLIVRPQDSFTTRPDNSHALFVPTLRSKPNAIVGFQDCTSESDPETGDHIHPYLSELEAYGKGIGQYRYDSPALNPRPPPLNETLLDIIDAVDGLSNM